MSDRTREPQYQAHVALRDAQGLSRLGLRANAAWHADPKHGKFAKSDDDAATDEIVFLKEVVSNAREMRIEARLQPGERVGLAILTTPATAKRVGALNDYLSALGRLSRVNVGAGASAPGFDGAPPPDKGAELRDALRLGRLLLAGEEVTL